MNKRRKKFSQRLKNFQVTLSAWAMEIISALLGWVPMGPRIDLIRAVGAGYGWIAQGQKNSLRQNLKKLLDLDDRTVAFLADEAFKNFSMTLYDFFNPKGLQVDVPDRQKLEELRRKHGGLLLLTFHMGNWELGARTMRDWGWPVTAVYQPYTNKKFKDMIEKRRAEGVQFIPVGRKAAVGVHQALQRGDVVAMLGDHPFGEEGTTVNLLGHKVKWPKGPVVLAVRAKAPIVVAVVLRTSPRKYRAVIGDPIFPEGKYRTSVDRMVQDVANKFGTLLQQNPTQWYRFRPMQSVKTAEEKI